MYAEASKLQRVHGTGWSKLVCLPRLHPSCVPMRGGVSEIKVLDLRNQAFCYPWLRGCSSGCLSSVRRLDGATGTVPRFGCHRLRLLQNSTRLGVRGLLGGDDNAWVVEVEKQQAREWTGQGQDPRQ